MHNIKFSIYSIFEIDEKKTEEKVSITPIVGPGALGVRGTF